MDSIPIRATVDFDAARKMTRAQYRDTHRTARVLTKIINSQETAEIAEAGDRAILDALVCGTGYFRMKT